MRSKLLKWRKYLFSKLTRKAKQTNENEESLLGQVYNIKL